jgi:D-glycero-D-manno-heptose 1,7-bisphosphate phosphatase
MHILRVGHLDPKIETLLIFDRDGTLNLDKGYSHRPVEAQLSPFAEGVKHVFERYSFAAAVASNQSGINRGFFKLGDFEEFSLRIISGLDPHLEHFFCLVACPHLPSENCKCRKPETGMINQIIAAKQFSNVLLIGNSKSDELTARNANLSYLDVNSPSACKLLEDWVELYCDNK